MDGGRVTPQVSGNARLEAFSDGVFAIAITLLILDLKVPELESVTPARLGGALLAQWPTYLAFLVSFLTVLIGWVNHHSLFRQLRGHTRPMLFANGLLLLAITAVPFPTALVARYILTAGAGVAALVYCALMVLISVGFSLVWSTASRGGVLPDPRQGLSRGRLGYVIGNSGYGLALLLAYPFPLLGLGICVLMAVFYSVFSYDR